MRQVERVGFPFYAPFGEVLIKGAEENGRWVVYLEASNELKDQDGEVVDMEALQKAAAYYLSHGVLSWDHKHKQMNDPEFIIGEPMDVRFTEDRKTLVKGWLYQNNIIAQKLWRNIKSGAKRLGASIGGGVLQKAAQRLKRVIWDETAITHKPINDTTLGNVKLIPFGAFAKSLAYVEAVENGTADGTDIEEFIKALMAGDGVNAANFTGGRALTPESLQGSTVKMQTYTVGKDELDQMFKSLTDAMIKGKVANYNDLTNFVLDRGYSDGTARRVITHVAQNLSLR